MNYTKKSFSVTAPGSQQYRDNWERTFRGEVEPTPSECRPGKPFMKADYHEGAEQIGCAPERYRCRDCGREWEP